MQNRIHDLIIKLLKGKITSRERAELEEFIARSAENKEAVEKLTDPNYLAESVSVSRKLYVDKAWKRVRGIPPTPIVSIRRYVVAAVVLGIVVFLIWIFYPWKSFKQAEYAKENKVSSEFYRGILNKGKGDELSKAVDTVKTLKKSYYSQKLPDGSTVWLNSESSLIFPASFPDDERVVQLIGEGYFEVAKDPSRPFKVRVRGMELVVVGTKFNVRAYNDEDKIHTTLLEGSVAIKTRNKTDSLKPREQAFLSSTGRLEKAGVDRFKKTTLAWLKENKFAWDNEHLETLIGDICHWYGLRPVYKTNVSFGTYSAVISRGRPLYQTLTILESVTPYKYEVVGDTLEIKQR